MTPAAPPPPPIIRIEAPPVAAQLSPPAPSQPAETVRPRRVAHAPGDPLEGFNRRMFAIHQGLDRAVIRPAAMGYKHVVPRVLRSGVRHFFSNLGEPVVFANFMLQLKPGSAVRTAIRFLVNSTIGLAGTIDVAKGKAFELPHRPNGFGDTLGFYGVRSGPYIFLPLVGPSDLRDLLGGQADGLLLPVVVGSPFDRLDYQVVKAVLTGLDQRAEADADLRALLGDALDPYATLRSVYLQDRAGEIAGLKGQAGDTALPGGAEEDPAAREPAAPAAAPELADPLADPAAPGQPPAAEPSAAPELQDPLADPAAPTPDPAGPRAEDPAGPVRR